MLEHVSVKNFGELTLFQTFDESVYFGKYERFCLPINIDR